MRKLLLLLIPALLAQAPTPNISVTGSVTPPGTAFFCFVENIATQCILDASVTVDQSTLGFAIIKSKAIATVAADPTCDVDALGNATGPKRTWTIAPGAILPAEAVGVVQSFTCDISGTCSLTLAGGPCTEP